MTVLFLPALILRSAKASLKNDSGVGAVQITNLARSVIINELNRLPFLHAPLGAIYVHRTIHGESQFIESALRHFLVVDANPTVILERSEGSKSEMRVTVLFLPA